MNRQQTRRRGFSLLEVLVGLAILMAGVLAVIAIFPSLLQGQRDAELLTKAAALAEMKAEEVRRDDSGKKTLVGEIAALTKPTIPIPFVSEPRLTYSFYGRSLLHPENNATSATAASQARVIIRYAPSYKAGQDVVYELRFN